MALYAKAPKNPSETNNRPKSYTAWLYENGGTPSSVDKTYESDLKAAEETYEKSLSTSAQNADALAESGLENSGYASYLDRAAKAAKEEAVSEAKSGLAARQSALKSSYESYLADYAQNQQKIASSLKTQLVKDGVTNADVAYGLALNAGLGEALARSVAAYGTEVSRENAKKKAVGYAVKAGMNSTEAYRYALGVGLSADAATKVAEAAAAYLVEHEDFDAFLASLSPTEYLQYLHALNQESTTSSEK